MYVNAKMILVETTLGIWVGDGREWLRRWIHV
jgi:hypothetical protein